MLWNKLAGEISYISYYNNSDFIVSYSIYIFEGDKDIDNDCLIWILEQYLISGLVWVN